MNHAANESGRIAIGDTEIPFKVSRSRRRRRSIAFTMEAPATLHVMAPTRASLSYIRNVIHKNSGWITRRLKELQKTIPDTFPQNFVDGESIAYLGHEYFLKISYDHTRPQGCRLLPHRLEVNVHGAELTEDSRREEVRLEIMLWLKKRAKVKLQKRLDIWSAKMELKYQRMVVSNPSRLWGSCSAQNVIRLNWRLIMAPQGLIDYVAAHELAHVAHKNHSPRFWQCVAMAMPDCKARRVQLRALRHRFMI